VPIGQVLSATFSQTMNPSTMNTTTFTLSVTGGAAVSGIVTPSGTYATFMPNAPLLNSTSYTATVHNRGDVPGGHSIGNQLHVEIHDDYAVPNVVSTVPKNLATSVPIGQALTATFNEPMTPDTLDAAPLRLRLAESPYREPSRIRAWCNVYSDFQPGLQHRLHSHFTTGVMTRRARSCQPTMCGHHHAFPGACGGIHETIEYSHGCARRPADQRDLQRADDLPACPGAFTVTGPA